MDVVGIIGYTGQCLSYVGPEKYAFISGNGLCMIDCHLGPREILWKSETGINAFAFHQTSCMLAMASRIDGDAIQIIHYPNQNVLKTLPNPSTGKIIDLAFSRDGKRLLAITDITDHKVCVWDVDDEHTLLAEDLPSTVKTCSINPSDSSVFVVSGNHGLLIGTMSEVMGEFSVRLDSIQIDPEKIESANHDDDINNEVKALSLSNSISFALWAPGKRLIVGNCQGFVVDVDAVGKVAKSLFRIPQAAPGNRIATIPNCGLLSSTYLVIGASSGTVYWYSFDKLTEKIQDKDAALQPSQIISLTRNGVLISNVRCLLTDPTFSDLIIGSSSGLIYQTSLDLQSAPGAEGGGEDEGLEGNDVLMQEMETIEVAIEPVYDMHEGAVLFTKSFFLPVCPSRNNPPHKGSDLLSVYITASHLGILTFWRPPAVEVENMTAGSAMGVRRSVPRVLQVLCRGRLFPSISSASGISKWPSATAVERFSVTGKLGSRTFGVGTSDGWVEIWQVRAFLSDDEEDGGEEEDGGILKMEVQTIARRHVFRSAVTIIASHENKPCVAIGSSGDHRVYIMSTTRAAKFQIVSYVAISESIKSQPIFCLWSGILLWLGCDRGKLYTFQPYLEKSFENANPEEPVRAKVSWDTAYTSIGNAFLTASGGIVIFSPDNTKLSILPSLPTMMELEQANLLQDENTLQVPCMELPGNPIDTAEHHDHIICISRSANGAFIASGTADGTVYIWKIRRTEVTLMNKLSVHSAPVLTVTFNSESSQVMSGGADGSVFITNVEKATPLRNDPASSGTVLDEDELRKLAASEERGTSTASVDKLWVELKQAEAMDSLHDEYRGKFSELRTSVQDLASRLEVLLQRNDSALDIEKMDRSEFVIDLHGRDELLRNIGEQEKKTREEFEFRNLKNELVAARIRRNCWDSMEYNSRRLLPFQPELEGKVYLPSFAVKRHSEKELSDLERVRKMRLIEMKAQRAYGAGSIHKVANGSYRMGWSVSLQGCPQTTSWIVNDALNWPSADVIDMLTRKEKQESEAAKSSDKKDSAASQQQQDSSAAVSVIEDEDDGIGSSDAFDQDFDEKNIFNLLYPPVAIRSQIQKRTQIILLNEVVRLIKVKFNEYFDRLVAEKEDVMASIESRNSRIKEIFGELHILEPFFQPQWDDQEIAGSSITVRDSEISCRPYETEALRRIRLAEEEERKKRAAEKDKENVEALALQEMMNGTLEVKRDVFAEASALKKPDWMTEMRVEDMSEAQRREVEEFETKFKALQEEQIKYRKSLELELKRLKGEVQDISKAFDEKLIAMSRLRMLTQKEILSQELIMSRLSVTMIRREQLWSALKSTEQSIEEMRQRRNELHGKIEKFSAQVEEEKRKLSDLQEEENFMDRTFKRKLQELCPGIPFDQEKLKVFNTLYRKRQYADDDLNDDDMDEGDDNMSRSGKRRSSRHSSNASGKLKRSLKRSSGGGLKRSRGGQSGHHKSNNARSNNNRSRVKGVSGMGSKASVGMGPLQQAAHALLHVDDTVQNLGDPFYAVIVKQEKAQLIADSKIPLLAPLSMESDCPEGFVTDQFTWQKAMELRTARIQKEIDVIKLSKSYGELKKKFDALVSNEDILIQQIDTLKVSRDSIINKLYELERNIELVVAIRQGQDEVDKDAVVTDYSGALLIPTEVVTKYNFRISELGKEKAGVLSRMKQFRRKINLVDWEAQHLRLQNHHLDEYFTDHQLLRITRELQQVIRDGSDSDQSKIRLEKSLTRKDFLSKDSEEKVAKLNRVLENLQRQFEDRKVENESLEEQILGLKREVAARESVRQSRDDARGYEGDPAQTTMKKMKKIVARRQLVDLARTQAEEIDILRQELDKMRQKTFPSFVKATRTRVNGTADEV